MAGIPVAIINQAKLKLQSLEADYRDLKNKEGSKLTPQNALENDGSNSAATSQWSLESIQDILNEIDEVNPDQLSPREALEHWYQLKSLFEKNKTVSNSR